MLAASSRLLLSAPATAQAPRDTIACLALVRFLEFLVATIVIQVGCNAIVAPCRATAAPLENLAKIAKPNTIETMKGPAESGKICSVEVEEK
jgi:hypothetical protein